MLTSGDARLRRTWRRAFVPLAASVAVFLTRTTLAAERHPALSPQEALQSFRVESGLRIELVAAEPLVVDPVALAFDEHERLFVVEGRGYPDPVEGGGSTTLGRIVLLEDSDGDGRYDRRKEFATGLGYVNGIAPWRGGIFVTAAPDILFLKDNDGDGVADERRVVLTGFDKTKTAQLRMSHPTLGLDGWMYVTSGINGGKVTSPLHPERPTVTFSLRDGRFNPDTFAFENTGGRGQFGLTFDPFGRRFICSNRHPAMQVMLEPWQLQRNPHLAFNETMQHVSKVEAEAKVFPISRATLAADFIPSLMAAPHTGTFTSACGVLIFGGAGLASEHVGNVFICEPAQNLVQRQVLRPEGASFRSELARQGTEFLASTDVWFRPVFLASGPEGALYVADMYRREIDHPRYIPVESRGKLDFESGKDRGRIYRIVKDDTEQRARVREKPKTAVAALESPDEWWRQTGFRQLLERRDAAAVPLLERIAERGQRAESRTRALWALHGLKKLQPAIVTKALRDSHPGVREQAVRLAGELLAGESESAASELNVTLIERADDDDARVRFATALALGSIDDAAVTAALAMIGVRDADDEWTAVAVLSGIGGRLEAFQRALEQRRGAQPQFARMRERFARVFGAGAPEAACREFLHGVIAETDSMSGRFGAALGLVEGFRGRTSVKSDVVGTLLGGDADGNERAQAFFRAAVTHASDASAPARERAAAIALLGFARFELSGDALATLLDARQPPEVQIQAVRALERIGDPRGGALLVARERWTRYTPPVREAVLATLLAKPASIAILLGAIRDGVIAAPEISSSRRTQLLKHADLAVRKDAEAVFKHLESGDRMAVYRGHREKLAGPADVARGKEAFARVCATCHTMHGVGGKVGPDLTGIRNQPADAILLHILVPNYEVAPNYQAVTVVADDGRAITGWLAAESESGLTLRTSFGTEESVLRKNIRSLMASGVSLMPDGLEQAMADGELASLVAFLKSDG